jgi:hypothetical protein
MGLANMTLQEAEATLPTMATLTGAEWKLNGRKARGVRLVMRMKINLRRSLHIIKDEKTVSLNSIPLILNRIFVFFVCCFLLFLCLSLLFIYYSKSIVMTY